MTGQDPDATDGSQDPGAPEVTPTPARPAGAFAPPTAEPAATPVNEPGAAPEPLWPVPAAPYDAGEGHGPATVGPGSTAGAAYGPGPYALAAPASRPTSDWPRPRARRVSVGMTAGIAVLALVAGAVGGVAANRIAAEVGMYRPVDAALPESSAATQPAGAIATIAAEAIDSVVSLEVVGDDGVSTGSGVVIRADGYILTNNHVVADASGDDAVTVLMTDGSELPAQVVGRTSDYDLAVVKINATDLTPLVLGDSDEVVVGDPVVAVGAPLGLEGTVTTGIVSALHRPVAAGQTDTAFIDAIQTDAAINPGNSGGPLVNGAGEVVGINSAIAQPPGALQATGSIGLGFAIPSNQARRTAEELIETGSATYPVIGVLLDERYSGEGVQVVSDPLEDQEAVVPDGPADDAGIEPGDVILAIDGRPVTRTDELVVAIRAKAPGDEVTLQVRSGDEESDVVVVLDEAVSE
ncbi:putative serine protease PepD [Paraoerskovia marina]|uniref:Putative serine protease PepD n=1 Tax=Paraoerskovia marina TaxID=545619 RepID=A0A1H1UM91_9CELL|nr:trypsin-like peptidase domain-containing protein [Paraoerskovia marina]SDS73654.1 putative serine protease PepD [Paraoerskovia marina]